MATQSIPSNLGINLFKQARAVLDNSFIINSPADITNVIPAPGIDRVILPFPIFGFVQSIQSVAYSNVNDTAKLKLILGEYAFDLAPLSTNALLTFGSNTDLPIFTTAPTFSIVSDAGLYSNTPAGVTIDNNGDGIFEDGAEGNQLIFNFSYLILNLVTGELE